VSLQANAGKLLIGEDQYWFLFDDPLAELNRSSPALPPLQLGGLLLPLLLRQQDELIDPQTQDFGLMSGVSFHPDGFAIEPSFKMCLLFQEKAFVLTERETTNR